MNQDLEKAFSFLFGKNKKKDNPKYEKKIDKNGHIYYKLRSIEEHEITHPHVLSYNDFYKKLSNNEVDFLETPYHEQIPEIEYSKEYFDELSKIDDVEVVFNKDVESCLQFVREHYNKLDFNELVRSLHSTVKQSIDEQEHVLKVNKKDLEDIKIRSKIILDKDNFVYHFDIIQDHLIIDNFGFHQNLSTQAQRTFFQDKVKHSNLFVSKSMRGTNLGGTIMKCFYEQYKNCGVRKINVEADYNEHEDAVRGTNVWGKWGFTMDKGDFDMMLTSFKRGFKKIINKSFIVREGEVVHNDIETININLKSQKFGNLYQVNLNSKEFTDPDLGYKYKILKETKGSKVENVTGFKTKYKIYYKPTEQELLDLYNNSIVPEIQVSEGRVYTYELHKRTSPDCLNVMFKESVTSWSGELDLQNEQELNRFTSCINNSVKR